MDTAHTPKIKEQIAAQRLLLTSRPEDCARNILWFLAYFYFVARSWPDDGADVIVRALLESSEALRADIDHFAEGSAEDQPDEIEELLFITQRVWRQSTTWETPGVPENTAKCYDEELDILAAKREAPSALHSCIITKSPEIGSLIAAGAKLHLLSRPAYPNRYRDPKHNQTIEFRKHWDTPTSLSMYTSDDFCYWKDALARTRIPLPEFATQELSQNIVNGATRSNPLQTSGWTEENLELLLCQNLTPSSCAKSCACHRFNRTARTLKQPKWLRFLAIMKRLSKKELEGSTAAKSLDGIQALVEDSASVDLTESESQSPFCFPDHKGCYLCEDCWFDNGYVQEFWSTRDIDPDYEVLSPEERLSYVDEEDSPFLLTLE